MKYLNFEVMLLTYGDTDFSNESIEEVMKTNAKVPAPDELIADGSAVIDTDSETCFNRTMLLEIINAATGESYSDFDEIVSRTDASFCQYAQYDKKTNQLELVLVCESNDCGYRECSVNLTDEERTDLETEIRDYFQNMIDKYLIEHENDLTANDPVQE